MPALIGRDLRIKYDADGPGGTAAAVIAGARVDGGTWNNEPIEATDKDDAGIRTLLDDTGMQSLDLNVSGVMKDDTLFGLARSGGLNSFELDITGLVNIAGLFFISNFEPGGEDGANVVTFSCQMQSSGALTVT